MLTCLAPLSMDHSNNHLHHLHYQPHHHPHISNSCRSSSSHAHLERVPGLWFQDGTMVFRAENTIFRVYHGLLRSKSSVFQDMMSFPQPENAERIEGCPLVQLFDSAEDVTQFFKAIFDPEYFLPPPTSANFQTVSSVLRLATKYDVAYLRRRALSHLANSYPTTLEGFDNRLNTRTIPFYENAPFAVVNLAREVDAPWLLPAALYCCCMLSYATFFSGVPFEEGNGKQSSIHLSPNDKRICVLGRAALIHAHNHDIYGFLRSESLCTPPSPSSSPFRSHKFTKPSSPTSSHAPSLSSPPSPSRSTSSASYSTQANHARCRNARLTLCEETLNDEECYPLARNFGWTQFKEEVCEECFKECKKRYEDARKALWTRLPELFELGDWDRLKAIQRGAFET